MINYQMPNTITTQRLVLKKLLASPENAIRLWDAVKEENTLQHLKAGGIYFPCADAEDTAQMISSTNALFARGGFNYYLLKDNHIIGNIYGERYLPGCQIDMYYFLTDEATGKGYMVEALKGIEKEHFKRSDIPLSFYILKSNEKSYHVVRRFGGRLMQTMNGDRIMCRFKSDWERDYQPQRVCGHTVSPVQIKGRSR
ncbi:MAG: GNAT family N-acetyltransferase [Alphaproteobacteria bacterium]